MSWVRQLQTLFGVTWFAITTILTVFMAGIAVGSLLVGRLVDRRGVPPLLLFVGLELFLAAYAQAFPHLLALVERAYVALAGQADLSLAAHTGLRFAFAVAVLAAPTLASGATLPAACKGFVRDDGRIGAGVAALYGANVIGAAAGCFATAFLLIGLLGFPATAWLATGLNLAAAVLGLAVHVAAAPPLPSRVDPDPIEWHPGSAAIAVAYLTVGFCALSGELLWTRVFSQFHPNPAAVVFGLVLTTFLLGHAAGAGLLYPGLRRVMRPRAMFVLLMVCMGLATALAVLALYVKVDEPRYLAPLTTIGVAMPLHRLALLVPAVFAPAMASGALFPLASALTIRGVRGVATGVGGLAALSTVGGVVGSLATGFALMPAFGAVRCLVLVAVFPLVAAVWAGGALRGAVVGEALAAPLLVTLVAGIGSPIWAAATPPYLHLSLADGETVLSFHEGRNTSSAVTEHPFLMRRLTVHGEWVGAGGSDLVLASSLHGSPRRAVVIGAGAGWSVLDALVQPGMEAVWAVDLDGMMPVHIPLLLGELRWSEVADERLRFVADDGRHFLLASDGGFDIIANDAAVYAWYLELSTLEFNRLARSRLAPEGLYVGRLHMDRITEQTVQREMATFLEVFPNAAFWQLDPSIGMLVGRNGELSVTEVDRWWGGREPPELWYDAEQMAEIADGARLITDDRPLHLAAAFLWDGRSLEAEEAEEPEAAGKEEGDVTDWEVEGP